MNQHPASPIDRNNFIELLNQEFLAATGYGASAFLTPNAILCLYQQYLEQNHADLIFIKHAIRHSIPIGK